MPKKVLVVDDDPDIQELCRTIFEAAGFEAVSALTAKGERRQVAEGRRDLVVLDVMMAAAEAGFEMAMWLGREHPGLPVIMLSPIADAVDQVFDTSALPVSVLVNKPMRPKELLGQVEKLLPVTQEQE